MCELANFDDPMHVETEPKSNLTEKEVKVAIASSVGVTLDTIKPLLDGVVTVKRLADQGSDPRGAMPAVNALCLEQPTGRVLFPGGGMMEAEVLAVANTASRRVSRKRRADEGLGGSSTAVPEVASADAPSRILPPSVPAVPTTLMAMLVDPVE